MRTEDVHPRVTLIKSSNPHLAGGEKLQEYKNTNFKAAVGTILVNFQNTILQPDVHVIVDFLKYQVSRLVTVTKNRRTHHTIRPNARTPERGAAHAAGGPRSKVTAHASLNGWYLCGGFHELGGAPITGWSLFIVWGYANNWMVYGTSMGKNR